MIPLDLKQRCLDLYENGWTKRKIYDEVFKKEHSGMSFECFKVKMWNWGKSPQLSRDTLNAGTYEGFIAHGATVQIDANGELKQAWIKQKQEDVDYSRIIEQFKESVPLTFIYPSVENGESMLEIPLFDMHFGVATFDTYKPVLEKVIKIIRSKSYEEINIIFGQDMLHTNDMKGNTSNGTMIGEIDFPKAWFDAWQFWDNVLSNALQHASRVNMIYSKGNHDECASWCLFKALEVGFPQVHFDDSLAPYKCINWKECFIGFSHGDETRKAYKDYRGRFTISFPTEFSNSKVREIHLGHLHCESERGDEYGVLVRRLSSKVPTDEWTMNQGFVGTLKRFMLFEWNPGELSAIYYI